MLNRVVMPLMYMAVVQSTIILNHIDTEYMPVSYNPVQYEFDSAAVEKGALDSTNAFIYAVGLNLIHVIDFRSLAAISNVYHVVLPDDVGATDVATCGTWVAVAASDNVDATQGRVYIYTTYTTGGQMSLIHTITVGTLPDQLVMTSDCSTILVAIEGSVTNDISNNPYDAEGEVVIMDFATNPAGTYTLRRADFTRFNAQAEKYVADGIRWVYRGSGPLTSTFSQDLEPEYMSLNYDESLAYVILQENNALATLNISAGEFIDIYPLGQKDWFSSALDPSDKDGGVSIRPWNIYGAYQPDAIKYVEYNGHAFLLTANEGDQKEYDGDISFTETQRGHHFVRNNQIAPSVPASLVASLDDDAELGRLHFSLVDYQDDNGQYTNFLAYGGRSFSLFRFLPDGNITRHWDSGSQLEQEINTNFRDVFNSKPDANEEPVESFDGRSDNVGPEPETVETGEVNGVKVIFVGIERPGFLAVFSVDELSATPTFESIIYSCGTDDLWNNMYDNRTCWDLDPEGLKFIPADKSPSGVPLLAVFSAVTSTVSLYSVTDTQAKSNDPGTDSENGRGDENAGAATSGTGLSTGEVVGVAIGCIALTAILILGTQFILKKRKSDNQVPSASTTNLPQTTYDQRV